MAKSLSEYADWLDERRLIRPQPPAIQPAKATPSLKPLPGVKAVTWGVYGTLLRISDGELLLDHPQELRMQVALDKTIGEFNMWNSMVRKPGEPWKQMCRLYQKLLEHERMAGGGRQGNLPEVDARSVWRIIVGRLRKKGYAWESSLYGDEEQLVEKIVYFFHRSLQGTEASPNALRAVTAIADAGLSQSLMGNGQCFTLVQLLRGLQAQGTLPPPGRLFALDRTVLSFREGVRAPSETLYRRCARRMREAGIEPREVLHVGCRLADDLAAAKAVGMRTALYAADKTALRASRSEINDPELRPDRLLTDLAQIRDVLAIG
ncbi:MAG: HAD hydrolase-like protein [Planctomycetaceae bacterium]